MPAHPGRAGKRAVKRVCVCVCVCRQFVDRAADYCSYRVEVGRTRGADADVEHSDAERRVENCAHVFDAQRKPAQKVGRT